MKFYAIGDLHLSYSTPDKTMEKFGWEDYQNKIFQSFQEKVNEEDIVLIPGDISWAIKLEDAYLDLEKIKNTKGKKILLKGNHDYWWQSLSKMKNYDKNMFFMQNEVYEINQYVICGTRGWICPNNIKFDEDDEKVYKRETVRLKNNLELASKTGKKIILLMHFPPTNDKKEDSNFTKLIDEYNVYMVIYGHLHGKDRFKSSLLGKVNNTMYELVSSDYLDFNLKELEL